MSKAPETEDLVLLETNWNETIESFDDLQLKKDLLRGIYGFGYVKPSAIQQQGIKPILLGKDVIAQAQSGSGKTATFVIGALQKLDSDDQRTQILIMAHTKELANQIYDVVKGIGLYLKCSVHVCTGGTKVVDDKTRLKEGA